MPVAIIPAAIAAFQIGKGIIDEKNAKKDEKDRLAKIKPYETPQEVYDVLNATQANAQTGFDATSLQFLTDQTDQAFASSLGIAERLGSDPNTLSTIFSQKIDALKGVSAQNHQMQMQNFNAYLSALNAVGAGDAAEQKSAQDQLKDQLQKIGVDKQVATQQISAGLNTGMAAYSNYQMGKLYGTGTTGTTGATTANSDVFKGYGSDYAAMVAEQNARNTRGFNP